jgi:hypothetical protein
MMSVSTGTFTVARAAEALPYMCAITYSVTAEVAAHAVTAAPQPEVSDIYCNLRDVMMHVQ